MECSRRPATPLTRGIVDRHRTLVEVDDSLFLPWKEDDLWATFWVVVCSLPREAKSYDDIMEGIEPCTEVLEGCPYKTAKFLWVTFSSGDQVGRLSFKPARDLYHF
jgi:hypothetical protein